MRAERQSWAASPGRASAWWPRRPRWPLQIRLGGRCYQGGISWHVRFEASVVGPTTQEVSTTQLCYLRAWRGHPCLCHCGPGVSNQSHHAWYAIIVFVAQRGAVAAIAQLGERQTEDLKVPGSIPGLGTYFSYRRGRPRSSRVGPMMHHHAYTSLGSWLLTPASRLGMLG